MPHIAEECSGLQLNLELQLETKNVFMLLGETEKTVLIWYVVVLSPEKMLSTGSYS